MKIKNIVAQLIVILSILHICTAKAVSWNSNLIVYFTNADLSYNGAADSHSIGEVIGSTWVGTGSESNVIDCGLINCNRAYMEASGPVSTGLTVNLDGITHVVWDSGIPGIGYAVSIKDPNASVWIPLTTDSVQTFPTSETSSLTDRLGWEVRVTFIKTATHLESGTYFISSQKVATLTGRDVLGFTATSSIWLGAATVSVTASGCVINSSESVSVNLGDFSINNFSGYGSTSGNGSFSVDLKCDNNVSVNAVLSDQSNTANVSNVVSLTSESTATGIGVQFFYNGNAVDLGPDSSATNTTNQFFITTTSSSDEIINVPFDVKYIQIGDITSGSANARAGITFSYQ